MRYYDLAALVLLMIIRYVKLRAWIKQYGDCLLGTLPVISAFYCVNCAPVISIAALVHAVVQKLAKSKAAFGEHVPGALVILRKQPL